MSFTAIALPHRVAAVFAISCTRLLPASAMITSPEESTVTPAGLDRKAALAAAPSPAMPAVPAELPAIVYTSLAVRASPHWVPPAAATSWRRLLPPSAMNRSPAESNASAPGPFRNPADACPPSPPDPDVPTSLPATVDILSMVSDTPHWVFVATGISSTRESHVSAMYRSPAGSNATACGWFSDCLLYTSDAADDLLCVDLGGRRI